MYRRVLKVYIRHRRVIIVYIRYRRILKLLLGTGEF